MTGVLTLRGRRQGNYVELSKLMGGWKMSSSLILCQGPNRQQFRCVLLCIDAMVGEAGSENCLLKRHKTRKLLIRKCVANLYFKDTVKVARVSKEEGTLDGLPTQVWALLLFL